MLIEPLSGRRQLKRSRSDSEWSTPSLTTGQSGTHYTQTKMLKLSKIYMLIELFHIVMVMLIVVIKIFLAI